MKLTGNKFRLAHMDAAEQAKIMRRQAAALDNLRHPAEAEIYGDERAQFIAEMNIERAKRGIPPFVNDEIAQPHLTERRRSANEQFRQERVARRSARSAHSRGI